MYVLARPTGAMAPAVAELRAAVTSLDPHVPLIGIRTLESAMGAACEALTESRASSTSAWMG